VRPLQDWATVKNKPTIRQQAKFPETVLENWRVRDGQTAAEDIDGTHSTPDRLPTVGNWEGCAQGDATKQFWEIGE